MHVQNLIIFIHRWLRNRDLFIEEDRVNNNVFFDEVDMGLMNTLNVRGDAPFSKNDTVFSYFWKRHKNAIYGHIPSCQRFPISAKNDRIVTNRHINHLDVASYAYFRMCRKHKSNVSNFTNGRLLLVIVSQHISRIFISVLQTKIFHCGFRHNIWPRPAIDETTMCDIIHNLHRHTKECISNGMSGGVYGQDFVIRQSFILFFNN